MTVCGDSGDTGVLQLADARVDRRLEVTEVGRVDGELGGDDDLVHVDRGLGVVALHRRLSLDADDPRVVVGRVDGPGRLRRRGVRVSRSTEPPSVLHHPRARYAS